MNKAFLIGRLTQDPQASTLDSGHSFFHRGKPHVFSRRRKQSRLHQHHHLGRTCAKLRKVPSKGKSGCSYG